MMAPTEDYGDTAERRGGWPPSLSLLSVRRPSLTGLPPDSLSSTRAITRIPSTSRSNEEISNSTNMRYLPDTEQEETNMPDLTQGLEIKMQGWVGEGVGKMSISPSGRDVVLAARSGLYVIDLEMPLELPRFVPQGGTWDVADVQWNPHPSRGNLVVSTSSEKLLIWNLDRTDRSAIQHILSKHYRSITDVNWHNHHPDIVTSTGIDSWIWVWDLRTALKPVTGLCAFNPGATQVKWNRHDENILASSHGNTLLIWDQRKGALPLATVKAHSSRIYGIDWSRFSRNEIATCSLDCTIKFWDEVNLGYPSKIASSGSFTSASCSSPTMQPVKAIHTGYPVWRSRYSPFGDGVLSLPHRGFRKPELLRYIDNGSDETTCRSINLIPEGTPGEGIVKECAWRVKGGFNSLFDDREFQLVTWNEDRTIRAWPISSTILEEAGFIRGEPMNDSSHRPSKKYISYRNVSEMSSSKLGDHIMLDGLGTHPTLRFNHIESDSQIGTTAGTSPSRRIRKPGTGTATIKRGGTMTKGPCKFKSKRSGMHALTWMPSVRTVGKSREIQNGSRSKELFQRGYESLESSMASLDSFRFGDGLAKSNDNSFDTNTQRIDDRTSDFEPEITPTWAEELTSAVNKLSASRTVKISLEKVWLRKRMCRLGLQGPWGESSSIFVRVTFAFPKDYPYSLIPPQIDLEKNHLIPLKRRTMLLSELRLLGKKSPCIEPCLRLLLGLPIETGNLVQKASDMGSESSSEDEARAISSRGKDITMTLEQGFAEPRTSQGIFSPNGKLVIFSHIPARMVKNSSRNVSLSPSANSRFPTQRNGSDVYGSSGGLSDALRHLTAAARDRKNIPVTVGMDENLLRALELFSYPKQHLASEVTAAGGPRAGYLVRPIRRSLVSIRDLADVTGLDHHVAKSYTVSGDNPTSFCLRNAEIAESLNRTDHERIFRSLAALLETNLTNGLYGSPIYRPSCGDQLSRSIISSLLSELVEKKDVLMLAMVSISLLIFDRVYTTSSSPLKPNTLRQLTHAARLSDKSDSPQTKQRYRLRTSSGASSITSQASIGRPSTSSFGLPSSLTSHSSSRSTWMGIANGVRYLVGTQDGQSTPKAQGSPIERSKTLPVVQESNPVLSRVPDNKQHSLGDNTQKHSPRFSVSFSLGYHEKESSRGTAYGTSTRGKRLTAQVLLMDAQDSVYVNTLQQLPIYVLAFAEILFRWGLKQKRSELLSCLPKPAARFAGSIDMNSESLLIANLSPQWNAGDDPNHHTHDVPRRPPQQRSVCTVCRLPVNGLSNVCLLCCHITHLSCWGLGKRFECPLGCGCECNGGGTFEVETGDIRNIHNQRPRLSSYL